MKYLFIQPEFENIGLEYISAVLKKNNHETRLAYIPKPFSNTAFKLKEDHEGTENALIFRKIEEFRPDVIGFSPFTSYFKWSLRKANAIKSRYPDVFILYGGVHATFIPEHTIINECVDGVIVGEGEDAIIRFSNNFTSRDALCNTSNLWIRQDGRIIKNDLLPLTQDLDALPVPDKDLFYDYFPSYQKRGTFTIMTGRGCPHRCTYCCNDVYKSIYSGQRLVRYMSPSNIIEQLQYFKKRYGFNRVDFMDDVFALSLKRLEELLPLYKRHIGLPFVCFMYPNEFTTREDVIGILKEHGCEWVKIGVQSAKEDYRRNVLNRLERNETIIRLADSCKKHHLSFSFDHILELPGETKEDLVEAVRLYGRCSPAIINFGSLIYLPKTRIVEIGLKEGDLSAEQVDKINSGEDMTALSSNISRFSGKSGREINYSIFTLLFILVTLLPKGILNVLLKTKMYNLKIRVPSPVLVILKIVSKIKARQGYVYFSAVKYFLYYAIVNRIGILLKGLNFKGKRVAGRG